MRASTRSSAARSSGCRIGRIRCGGCSRACGSGSRENANREACVMKRIALLIVVPIAAGVLLHAQPQAPPTFRSGTKLTVETVTVKDKDGTSLDGLTARDFTLTEGRE